MFSVRRPLTVSLSQNVGESVCTLPKDHQQNVYKFAETFLALAVIIDQIPLSNFARCCSLADHNCLPVLVAASPFLVLLYFLYFSFPDVRSCA